MEKTIKKSNYIMKAICISYVLTLVILFLYNILLTFTDMNADMISIIASFITTVSAAVGGFYASKKIKEKGLINGLLVGISYILLIFITVFLLQDQFKFDISMLYRIFLMTCAGGVGGILGVNFK
ncbi:MAG: TIGR04086 family membrane protein [Clostridioides sp.]|nr:TIGR04086 family membrane protein [Clostridioides sp.]